ncbi:MAG TPA: hypothetical protein VHE34_21225 [Puia sp.]|uniref:hypothetical protein n=1 Tax=Puia sp. TaxID=2045100 RepID=UPI002CCF026B|nr:hypothetical protein [Puia sp.]HVU97766.1 hypothetical protein [Puia sp.]
MIKYNKRIDEELKQLGFDNAKDIFKTAQQLFGMTYMYAEVPINGTLALGYDRIHFRFILMYPTKKYPYYIQHVNAATGRSKRDFRVEDHRTVVDMWAKDGPLSTREQLIAAVRAKAIEERKNYKELYRTLMMEKISKMRNNDQLRASLRKK